MRNRAHVNPEADTLLHPQGTSVLPEEELVTASSCLAGKGY